MIQVSKNTRTITIFGKKPNLPQKKKATDYPRKTTLNRQKIRTITNRAVRIAPVKKEENNDPIKENTSIFLSGGIGDVFALESYFTDETRHNLNTIYYGTRQYKIIEKAFSGCTDIFPKLKTHIPVWSDFSDFWAFHSKNDCIKKISSVKAPLSNDFLNSSDWSILKIFDNIKRGKIKYNGCSFLKQKPVDITKFNLPSRYVSICPCSTDKRLMNRDFSVRDWQAVENYLEKTNTIGVVLNNGSDSIPDLKNIINLNNKTSILESIEILKKSKFYIGIDSCMAILAARHFHPFNLMIKSVNGQFYDCQSIYCAPNKVRVNKQIDAMELDVNRTATYLLNQRGQQNLQ